MAPRGAFTNNARICRQPRTNGSAPLPRHTFSLFLTQAYPRHALVASTRMAQSRLRLASFAFTLAALLAVARAAPTVALPPGVLVDAPVVAPPPRKAARKAPQKAARKDSLLRRSDGGQVASPALRQESKKPIVGPSSNGGAGGPGNQGDSSSTGSNGTNKFFEEPGEKSLLKFKPRKCQALLVVVRRTLEVNIVLLRAFLVLSYFMACALLAFMVFVLVRIYALGARTTVVLRAAAVFVLLLIIAASLMLTMRALLLPLDMSALGVARDRYRAIAGLCLKTLGEWPKLKPTPYTGQPPIRTWPFFVLVSASYAGSIVLAASLAFIYIEERRGATAWKRAAPVFKCQCPPSQCVHT